jgi:hypothetical protein
MCTECARAYDKRTDPMSEPEPARHPFDDMDALAEAPDTAYVLVCRACAEGWAEPLPIPFESAEARGKWAAAHRDATGHDSWWVKDHQMGARQK